LSPHLSKCNYLWLHLAVVIAYAAYRAGSLNKSGGYAATLVGTVIFGFGSWQWAILLLTFFITSSGLSRAFQDRKQNLNEKFSKGHKRDAGQVFGNGGLAALFAGLHAFYPESIIPWVGFAACLAAVNADTWATELGVLDPTPPRLITNLKERVEKGTSGGRSNGRLWPIRRPAVVLSCCKRTDYWSLFANHYQASPPHSSTTARRPYKPCITRLNERDRETSTPYLRYEDCAPPRLEMVE
jgi:hypothetical protein